MKQTHNFQLDRIHVSTSKQGQGLCATEAIVKIAVRHRLELAVADGNGPVCALDKALFMALRKFWPNLKRVRLQAYSVKVVNKDGGTDSLVEVAIAVGNGSKPWRATARSTNVLEASWLVLARSYQHQLERLKKKKSAKGKAGPKKM